jgi:hypothetical protein
MNIDKFPIVMFKVTAISVSALTTNIKSFAVLCTKMLAELII